MKKRIIIFSFVLLAIFGIIFGVFKCKQNKTNETKIKLAEVTHSVFYTPMYVAIEKGYFKEQNINIELLLTGVKRKIDICTINGQPFVYCAGFGKFVNISYDTPRKLKEKFGYVAYWMKGVKEISNETKLYDIEYEIDGNIYCDKCSFMMVSNANRVAGIKTLYEDIKLNDSKFEVLFCKFNKTEIF